MDIDTNIARMLALMARAFGYSVDGLCQTPWDASTPKVPRLFLFVERGHKMLIRLLYIVVD